MTITTITIGAVDYVANASVAEADAYLAVDATRAETWVALTADQKGAKLVQGTRRMNLLAWKGEKTGGDTQVDAWPRTGVTYASGNSVSTTEVPQGVEDATILLAGSIALDAEVGDSGSSGTNVKRVKAGSAEVEFFRQQTGVPLQDETAYNLVKQFLAASGVAASAVGPYASGTDAESSFADIDQWGRYRGFP